MSNPFSVRDPSISHTKVENALLPKEGDDGSNFVLYVDNVNKRLGINNATPDQAIDCAGYIQLRSTPVQRLIFHDDAGDHLNADIGAAVDGTNGGVLGFITKIDGGIDTEKLRINNIGAIGIGGANYGDAGAVITSNGSGSAVSWNRPYFIKVKRLTDYPFTGTSGTSVVVGMSAVDFAPVFDYNGTTDWANDEWTCPQTGVYRITVQLAVQSTISDRTYYAGALLERTRAATTQYIYRNELSSTSDDDVDQIYLTGTTINRFEQGDDLRLVIGWSVISSGSVKARGDPVEDQTFLIIERII
jgi:hypothetical protein